MALYYFNNKMTTEKIQLQYVVVVPYSRDRKMEGKEEDSTQMMTVISNVGGKICMSCPFHFVSDFDIIKNILFEWFNQYDP